MLKISNPFQTNREYYCFACSPHNPIGLKMSFYETETELCSFWQPQDVYEGYTNVLHGGIQGTLMDELAAWTVYIKGKTAGVTQTMQVEYKKPVFINQGVIELRASYQQEKRTRALIKVNLYNHDKEICSTARLHYFIYPLKIAKQKFQYPGHAAFYK